MSNMGFYFIFHEKHLCEIVTDSNTHTYTHIKPVCAHFISDSVVGVVLFFCMLHTMLLLYIPKSERKKNKQLNSFCFVLILMTFCSNSQTKFSANKQSIFFSRPDERYTFLTGQTESVRRKAEA